MFRGVFAVVSLEVLMIMQTVRLGLALVLAGVVGGVLVSNIDPVRTTVIDVLCFLFFFALIEAYGERKYRGLLKQKGEPKDFLRPGVIYKFVGAMPVLDGKERIVVVVRADQAKAENAKYRTIRISVNTDLPVFFTLIDGEPVEVVNPPSKEKTAPAALKIAAD